MDETTPESIEGRAAHSGPDGRQRATPRTRRKLSPAELAEREQRRKEREYARCLLLLYWREYGTDGWRDLVECVEGEHYTPTVVQRNHWDQWEIRALTDANDRLAERDRERFDAGKRPARAMRLPTSRYAASRNGTSPANHCANIDRDCRLDCFGCGRRRRD